MAESGGGIITVHDAGLAAYDVEELADFLLENGITSDVVSNFEKNLVTGKSFLKLSDEDLNQRACANFRNENRD